MLSWSASTTGVRVDLKAITDPRVDPLIPGGTELIRFVDAVLRRTDDRDAARSALASHLAVAALIGAAGVLAVFQMMNRVADATGMPVGRGNRARNAGMIADLGLHRFDHSGDELDGL